MSTQADPRIGSELAGYRIDALLGRGGWESSTAPTTLRSIVTLP